MISKAGKLRDLKPMSLHKEGILGSQLTLKCWHFQQSGRVLSTVLAGNSGIFVCRLQKFQTAYCSSLSTVCWLVLAWASTAVAACCMICVRDSSVEAMA